MSDHHWNMIRQIIILIAIVNLSIISALPANQGFNEIATKNITTGNYLIQLDYFRPQSDDSRVLAYYSNMEFYENDGPIFIYINNGDGTITTKWITSGLMYEIASETNAALYTTDHRYFQLNRPTPSASFDDMTFLTIEQSLSDIAYLIDHIKINLQIDHPKIILWGSGYGATLATWAKQKYPHLIDGVWSSSGIFTSTNFTTEPYQHLSYVIQTIGGGLCASNVRNAFTFIELYMWLNMGEYLQEIFNLCDPVNVESDLDIAMLHHKIIQYIVEYFNEYQTPGIHNFCDSIGEPTLGTVEALGNFLTVNFLNNQSCFDFSYESVMELLQDETWMQDGTESGARQWYYLKCTQLGLFEVTARVDTLFGRYINEAYHYYSCKEIFGSNYTFNTLVDNLNRINIAYGGKNPGISNVIFTNGRLDTLINYGITEYNHPDSYVINLINFTRSADLGTNIVTNYTELYNAQDTIRAIILDWIG